MSKPDKGTDEYIMWAVMSIDGYALMEGYTVEDLYNKYQSEIARSNDESVEFTIQDDEFSITIGEEYTKEFIDGGGDISMSVEDFLEKTKTDLGWQGVVDKYKEEVEE